MHDGRSLISLSASMSSSLRSKKMLITGSIARSSTRRADFEVFPQHRRHIAPMGVKFGMVEGIVPYSVPKFTPIGATRV